MPLTADTTVYAKWTAGTANYTVVYMKQKWDNTTNKAYYVYDSSKVLSGTVDETVSGTNDKSYDYYHYVRSTSATLSPKGDTVVYSYYDLTEYTLKFDPKGGQIKFEGDDTTYSGNNYYQFNVVLGMDISSKWPTSKETTKRDTKFEDWDVPNSSSNYLTKRFEVTSDMLACADSGSTTITYTANWRKSLVTRTVEYWLQKADGTGYEKSSVYSQEYNINRNSTLSAKDIYGFTKLTGTPSGYNGTSGNVSRFYYNRNSHDIDYRYNDKDLGSNKGILFDASIASYEWTPTAEQAGLADVYQFEGWYDNSECVGEKYTFTTMPDNNLVLYAKFVAPEKQVTFKWNLGTDKTYHEVTVAYGSTVGSVEEPTREGYEFLGWFTDKVGGARFHSNLPIMQDMTVYAHWKMKALSYTVKYVDAAGNAVAPSKKVTNASFQPDQEITERAITVAGMRYDAETKSTTLKIGVANEITFVYSQAGEVSYTVHHVYIDEAGTQVKVADDVIGTTAAEQIVVKSKGEVDLNGTIYYPTETTYVMKLTSVAENNVYTFYYLPYRTGTITIEYYLVDELDAGRTESETLRIGGSVKAAD